MLSGKVAIITGGAGGFGKVFASALLRNEASSVCLLDISKDGKGVAAQLQQQFSHAKVDYYNCDVTDYRALFDVFESCKKKFGFIDIVCNNAGIASHDSDLERSLKAFKEAVYYGTKLGIESMDKNAGGRGGVIVNVASMAAFYPLPGSMVYTGTKAGVVGLTKCAALGYGASGVRVNTICPAFAETPIIDFPGMRDFIASVHEKILDPELVADGFIQLVKDESLNGAVMRVTSHKGIDIYNERKQISKL